jgi:hypothetical protein
VTDLAPTHREKTHGGAHFELAPSCWLQRRMGGPAAQSHAPRPRLRESCLHRSEFHVRNAPPSAFAARAQRTVRTNAGRIARIGRGLYGGGGHQGGLVENHSPWEYLREKKLSQPPHPTGGRRKEPAPSPHRPMLIPQQQAPGPVGAQHHPGSRTPRSRASAAPMRTRPHRAPPRQRPPPWAVRPAGEDRSALY